MGSLVGSKDVPEKRNQMTSRDFCFWLQGFFEITDGEENVSVGLTMGQTEIVRRHLDSCIQARDRSWYGRQ